MLGGLFMIICHRSKSIRFSRLIYNRRLVAKTMALSNGVSTPPPSPQRDLLSEIPLFGGVGVHIRDRANVNRVLNEIVKGGREKLQIVSDFDRTITKQHTDGKSQMSSFGIFAKCTTLPEYYIVEEKKLMDKYHPIEVDPTIPVDEKIKLMETWWKLSQQLLVGLQVKQEDIREVVKSQGPDLRDDCCTAFRTLHEKEIPVLVFSAGLGDCVEAVLERHEIVLSNVKVISNFLNYDESGTIQGFRGNTIHVYNKNEYALQGTEYHEMVKNRDNIILMGDSIGDANMADGVSNVNAVLKVGFLYDRIEESLPNYLKTFDIVLVDDQTMDILNTILTHVL